MKTIKQMINSIKKNEGDKLYQIYVVTKTKTEFKKYPLLIDGKPHYKVIHHLVYAKDINKEFDKKLQHLEIKQEKHIDISINCKQKESTHNVYYLYVDKIFRNNKATIKTINTEYVQYKEKIKIYL